VTVIASFTRCSLIASWQLPIFVTGLGNSPPENLRAVRALICEKLLRARIGECRSRNSSNSTVG